MYLLKEIKPAKLLNSPKVLHVHKSLVRLSFTAIIIANLGERYLNNDLLGQIILIQQEAEQATKVPSLES